LRIFKFMKGKILNAAIIAFVAASAILFGSNTAKAAMFGYGGGGGGYNSTPCTSVTYADWQGCVMGLQYRNVVAQTPTNCVMTASQQAARVQSCATTPACTSVTYSAWSTKCVLGFYSRNITGQAPTGCKITAAQELARVETCRGGVVLGEKIYANGTLLRGSDMKIYVVTNGALVQIKDLKELAKYAGQAIIDVDDSVIAGYPKAAVLGVKSYGNGQLIRAFGDVKVYTIIDGKKKHILDIPELQKYYFGLVINNVAFDEVSQYPNY
jgi:hypothetical protein